MDEAEGIVKNENDAAPMYGDRERKTRGKNVTPFDKFARYRIFLSFPRVYRTVFM